MTFPAVADQPNLYPLPHTGEAVDLFDPRAVAAALRNLREFQRGELRDAILVLESVLVEESKRQGAKTIRVGDVEAVVTTEKTTVYDIEKLRRSLRNADCPEDRIDELIHEQVTYKVDGRVARSLAAANPRYKRALERNRTTTEGATRVSVK